VLACAAREAEENLGKISADTYRKFRKMESRERARNRVERSNGRLKAADESRDLIRSS